MKRDLVRCMAAKNRGHDDNYDSSALEVVDSNNTDRGSLAQERLGFPELAYMLGRECPSPHTDTPSLTSPTPTFHLDRFPGGRARMTDCKPSHIMTECAVRLD